LRQLIDMWSLSRRRETRFELDIPPEIALPDNAAIHVFRIAQEGLTNAARHAGASHVRLSVEPVTGAEASRPTGINLTIEDDGNGRPTAVADETHGMGLMNMRERVAALGGSISFDDAAGKGLKVRVFVPVNAEERESNGHARH